MFIYFRHFYLKERKLPGFPAFSHLHSTNCFKVHECQPMCLCCRALANVYLVIKDCSFVWKCRLFETQVTQWLSLDGVTNCFGIIKHVWCMCNACTRSQFDRNPGERLSNLGHSDRSIPATRAGVTSLRNHARIVLERILYINKCIIARHQRCSSHAITAFPGFRCWRPAMTWTSVQPLET